MRILKAIGAKPRRTIRIALWGGEEEGLLGSRAYVREHFADPATMALKPEHAKLAAYFNSDNGTGRVRGVWMQSNLAVRPIFEQWIAPLKDLGVVALGPRSVSSTDHVSFDNVGLPGFQFMVDRLEYNSRTHHSNMDVVRPRAARRHGAAGDRHRRVRLRRRDARREAAAQGAARNRSRSAGARSDVSVAGSRQGRTPDLPTRGCLRASGKPPLGPGVGRWALTGFRYLSNHASSLSSRCTTFQCPLMPWGWPAY